MENPFSRWFGQKFLESKNSSGLDDPNNLFSGKSDSSKEDSGYNKIPIGDFVHAPGAQQEMIGQKIEMMNQQRPEIKTAMELRDTLLVFHSKAEIYGVNSPEARATAIASAGKIFDIKCGNVVDFFKHNMPPLYEDNKDFFDTLSNNAKVKESLVDIARGMIQQQVVHEEPEKTVERIVNRWQEKIPQIIAYQEKATQQQKRAA